MNKQGNEIKWIPANLLLSKIQYPEGRHGNYIVVRLSNYGNILINKRNLKALLPTTNRPYVIAKEKDFKKWLDRGFIIITLLHKRLSDGYYYQEAYSPQNKYYIINAKNGSLVCVGYIFGGYTYRFLEGWTDYFILQNTQQKSAIFDKDGRRISDWFDVIYPDGLVEGESDYYVVQKDDKDAIFQRDGKQVSDWYDNIYLDGLVKGKSDYYLAVKDGKRAIFNKDNRQITDWYDSVDLNGLVLGESNYYIVAKDHKEAIFHKSGKQISDWFDRIYSSGLIKGESDYYLAEKDDKYAIFHENGNQVSDWYDWIREDSLLEGKSKYYIARKNGKRAIFHENGNRISDWFDYISKYGLVDGESEYYIASKNGKDAIFHKDGKQVTGWLDYIHLSGIVVGQTEYFIAFIQDVKGKKVKRKTMYIGKLGSSKLYGPLKDLVSWYNLGFVSDPSSTSIAVYTLGDKRLDILKVEIDQFFGAREEDNENTR